MRILHAADLHIGSLRGLTEVSRERRLARHRAVLSSIYRIARRFAVDAVVLAGDIFDRKDTLPRERDLLFEVLSKSSVETLIINGNHDLLEEGYSQLHPLALMQNRIPKLYVAECAPRIVTLKGVDFILVPYTGSEEYPKVITELVNQTRKSGSRYTVVVGHECVAGSADDSGVRLTKGVTLPKGLPVTYYAMGDIHKRQRLGGLPNAFYPGSPAQHRFSETVDKGVLIVDLDNPTKPTFVRLKHPDVLPLVTKDCSTVDEVLDSGESTALVRVRAPAEIVAAVRAMDNVTSGVVRVVEAPLKTSSEDGAGAENPSAHTIDGRSFDPLNGLREWLDDTGALTPQEIERAVRMAHAMKESV